MTRALRLGLMFLQTAPFVGRPRDSRPGASTEAVLGSHPDRRSWPQRGGTVWVSADRTTVHGCSTGTELEVKIGVVFDGDRWVGRDP